MEILRAIEPLWVVAIKTSTHTAVIGRLLQPENFNTGSLDDPAMEYLAQEVESSEVLQEQVVRILAERPYFGIFLLEFYASILALAPSVVLLAKEILQIQSVGASYIGNL